MVDPIVIGSLGWLAGKIAEEAATRAAEHTIKHFLRKRAEAARDIALEEIAAGRGNVVLDMPGQDEAVAIMWRYIRAAEEGAARINLRLMASILAGKAEGPPIYASEFLRWADLIVSLSEQEIVFLAVLHREGRDEVARQHLVPRYFRDGPDFTITGHALIRTGLVIQTALSLRSFDRGLGGRFETSHRMGVLAGLADLEGVLRREGYDPS